MSDNKDIEVNEVELDEVDIEEYAKKGEKPPKAKAYIIRIDKDRKSVQAPGLNGEQILELAGKSSATHKLYQNVRGHQPKPIGAGEYVDFTASGVERFTTMARDTTEGRGPLRREFKLLKEDEDYLSSLGLCWETLVDGNHWLLVHDWQLPSGYSHERVTVALLMPPSYPDGEIDMMYVYPPLARVDQKQIGALSSQSIRGEQYQRWSRHRTAANPWRPGVDDVSRHMALVDEWFRREFEVR